MLSLMLIACAAIAGSLILFIGLAYLGACAAYRRAFRAAQMGGYTHSGISSQNENEDAPFPAMPGAAPYAAAGPAAATLPGRWGWRGRWQIIQARAGAPRAGACFGRTRRSAAARDVGGLPAAPLVNETLSLK